MRRAALSAFWLILGASVLGATVFQEPLASAAHAAQRVIVANPGSKPVQVQEVNTDSGGSIKVHEQGTANVNVTNSSLSLAPFPTVTGGAGTIRLSASDNPFPIQPIITTGFSVDMSQGASELILGFQAGGASFRIPGPNNLPSSAAHHDFALTYPLKFDALFCRGSDGSFCRISWIGAP
jgi:hypothetical protein